MRGISIALVLCVGLGICQGLAQNQMKQKRPEAKAFSGKCEEKNGRYAVAGQCDAYVECQDGVPEEKLCADGLLFNVNVELFTFPCQYPIDVDCSTRTKLQPAQATDECPHQFGYYRLGDSSHCSQFMNCANGKSFTFDCPEGLAFNEETYRCDWPDQVKVCDAAAFLGFTCPPEPKVPGLGESELRYYADKRDCRKYFVCIDGNPRMYRCNEKHAFNELTNGCDVLDNVKSCTL